MGCAVNRRDIRHDLWWQIGLTIHSNCEVSCVCQAKLSVAMICTAYVPGRM